MEFIIIHLIISIIGFIVFVICIYHIICNGKRSPPVINLENQLPPYKSNSIELLPIYTLH